MRRIDTAGAGFGSGGRKTCGCALHSAMQRCILILFFMHLLPSISRACADVRQAARLIKDKGELVYDPKTGQRVRPPCETVCVKDLALQVAGGSRRCA